MLAKVLSSTVIGIDAFPVEVEVDISSGLPALQIVGLPDAACRESADRVRAAVKNCGQPFPSKRITVNLAPADVKKEGSGFDLAIAIGVLVASEVFGAEKIAGKVFCGGLSLDGRIRGVAGMLPRAVGLLQEGTGDSLILSSENAKEVLCVKGMKMYAADHLSQVIRFLREDSSAIPELKHDGADGDAPSVHTAEDLDFADIKGQAHTKRGLEIAAAGRHNVLMIGPPGSGKTMLAKRVPSILSGISFEEAIEATKIHSVAGLLSSRSGLLRSRPFRDPHHTISNVAMVGGGTHPKPGEVSLAHNGVLFLDELAEFNRNVLEVLRQPLEEGKVTISRALSSLTLPARFMLVAAMNPCPCGYFTDAKKECHCSSVQIRNYMSKISGPLLDRIDIQLEVPCLKVDEITGTVSEEPSAAVRERVEKAVLFQRDRYKGRKTSSNAFLSPKEVEKYCALEKEGKGLIKMAIQELGFSARAYHKILKVARTIADLAANDKIGAEHVSEAIHYRTLDKSVWMR